MLSRWSYQGGEGLSKLIRQFGCLFNYVCSFYCTSFTCSPLLYYTNPFLTRALYPRSSQTQDRQQPKRVTVFRSKNTILCSVSVVLILTPKKTGPIALTTSIKNKKSSVVILLTFFGFCFYYTPTYTSSLPLNTRLCLVAFTFCTTPRPSKNCYRAP